VRGDVNGGVSAHLDPVQGLRWLAASLAAACQADPGNASIARELRMTLTSLLGVDGAAGEEDDGLAELMAMCREVP
jgi:hypothetical protein